MGGVPPLGYRAQDGKLLMIESEAEIVRAIFRRYAELGSVRSLKDELEAENLQRKAGPSIPRSSRKSARLWSVSGAGMPTPFSFAMTGLNMRASIIAR